MPFGKIKEGLSRLLGKQEDQEYIEIDLGQETKKNKVLVKPFILKKFEDVNDVLNSLREGYTIAVLDVRPLKQKDIIELKRAIAKLKKTIEALEGEVAGFGESIIIATPSFAQIYKPPKILPQQKKPDFY